MGNIWVNSNEEENKIPDNHFDELNENNKITSESEQFHPQKDIHDNSVLLEGFVRSMESKINGIIPASIIQLLCRYYDLWVNLKPARKMKLVHPYPIYYFSSIEKRGYIIITPHCKDSKTIIAYDTQRNCWDALTDYPQHFHCECHSIVLDPVKEILYFCFGHSQVFGWFDLKIKKWTLKCSKSNRFEDPSKYGIHFESDYGPYGNVTNPQLCFITDLSEIHGIIHLRTDTGLFEDDKHVQFDKITNKFKLISKEMRNFGRKNPNLIYVEKKQMMMALGGESWHPEDIDFCKISINTPNNYVWKEFPCCLPYKSQIKCQIIFDTLLIGYFAKEKEVWCLDLDLDIEYMKCKWLKCLDITLDVYHIVVTRNEFIHFFGTFSGIHSKVHLSQILPTTIYHKYYYAK